MRYIATVITARHKKIEPLSEEELQLKRLLNEEDEFSNSGNTEIEEGEGRLAFDFENVLRLAETIFDNSPQDYVLEQGAEGETWQVAKNVSGVSTQKGKTVKSKQITLYDPS